MEKKTTVYLKLNDRTAVRAEMTLLELKEWGDVSEREVTVTEMDAAAAMLSAKNYQCCPPFEI